jgi:hypothetical protein
MKVVRIKPYNPKKGFKLRTYVLHGTVFRETAGWYEVSDADAAYLATIRNSQYDGNAPLAFDVCTREEAQALEDAERKQVEKASATAPLRIHHPSVAQARDAARRAAREDVVTTADLPGNEADLESEDLAAEVAATPAPVAVPGAPKRGRRR